MTDVLGDCEEWNLGTNLEIRREDGEVRTIPLALVVSGKPVPPRPSIRQRVSIRDAEAHTLDLFDDQETTALGNWILRTQPVLPGRLVKRANSCFAFGDPGGEMDASAIEQFYAALDRPALVQVAAEEPWEAEFRSLGWRPVPGSETALQLTSVAQTRHRLPTPLHTAEVMANPAGRAVLRQGPVRVSVALARDWLAIYSLEVDPAQRRRGLARQLLAEAIAWGAERGATTAWLHVETDNHPAVALYASIGFRTHHLTRYWYSPRVPSPWSVPGS